MSTPLTWDEVEGGAESGGAESGGAGLRFLAPAVLERVESVGDLFAPLLVPSSKAPPAEPRRARQARSPGAKDSASEPGPRSKSTPRTNKT